MTPIDDEEDLFFEDDEPEAGDDEPEDAIEDAPGITDSMTSTAPEGEPVEDDADVPANSGKPGAFIAMPGGKRVRAT